MKSMMKAFCAWLARSPRCWWLAEHTVLRLSRAMEWQREVHEDHLRKQHLAAKTSEFFADLVVRHGPFQGVRYPWAMACGSPLFSKILGSYERELSGVVEELCRIPYTTILNIGSAEGYYAVGLAKRIPTATVTAFDINPEARQLARQLADGNGVGDRFQVDGACTPELLVERCRGKQGLIISDCEGYERLLFTPEVARVLTGWDILIEVHDLIDIEVSTSLLAAFAASHEVVRVQSVDDIQKALTYGYPELSKLSVGERRELLGEGRRSIMEWFIACGSAAPGGTRLAAACDATLKLRAGAA